MLVTALLVRYFDHESIMKQSFQRVPQNNMYTFKLQSPLADVVILTPVWKKQRSGDVIREPQDRQVPRGSGLGAIDL